MKKKTTIYWYEIFAILFIALCVVRVPFIGAVLFLLFYKHMPLIYAFIFTYAIGIFIATLLYHYWKKFF